MSLPDIGDEVMFHGRRWTVTAWREVWADDEDDTPCRELTIKRQGDDSTDSTLVDACAVRKAANHD